MTMTARKKMFRTMCLASTAALAILVSPAIAERAIEPPAKPIVYTKVGSWKITHHPENKSCNAADVNLGSTTVIIEAGHKTTGAWWMILMTNPKWTWTWGQDMELFLDTPSGKSWGVQFQARDSTTLLSEKVSESLIASLTGSADVQIRLGDDKLVYWYHYAEDSPTTQLAEVIQKLRECRREKIESTPEMKSWAYDDETARNLHEAHTVVLPQLTPVPIKTGVLHQMKGRAVAPLRIETPPGQDYLLKLVNVQNKDEMVIYVSRESSYVTKVPFGTYRIHGAVGQTWYGEKHRFGPDTTTHFRLVKKDGKSDQFTFNQAEGKAHGYTIQLVKLETPPIKADEF